MPKTNANTQTNRDGFEVLSKRRSEISRYQARGSRDDAQASGAVFACGYATLERCRIRREKSGTARRPSLPVLKTGNFELQAGLGEWIHYFH
jgi:hypothetical protein